MADTEPGLVERLRFYTEDDEPISDNADVEIEAGLIRQAAARIEALEKALEPFARVRIWPGHDELHTVTVTRAIRPDERVARIKDGQPDLGEGAKEIISLDGLKVGDFVHAASILLSPEDGR